LFSPYVLVSKVLILLFSLIILVVIKQKLLTTNYLVNYFLLLYNIMILYQLILISSFDFIVLLISMEGLSLILYGLGGFLVGNLISLEGILKYFILSSVTGCFTILGVSFLFGVFGSLDFMELQVQLCSNLQYLLSLDIHLLFFLTFLGFFFKLSIFPLH
jgi:NADH-quinone oxidoreductase subunit N